MRCNDFLTGSTSPAVNIFARYSSGVLISSIAGKIKSGFLIESLPSNKFMIGLSGGQYQTIGNVLYSGCNGNANLYSIASLYTGEFCAALIHSYEIPSFSA